MNPGHTFTIDHPFWRAESRDWDTGEITEEWAPGTEHRQYSPYDDGHEYADALGECTTPS